MTKARKTAYLALFVSALIWGIAPPVIKKTLMFVSPESFLFYRFLVSSIIVLVPLILRIRQIKPSKKDWLYYLFLGFLCTPLNLILLFWGINKTSTINASLISIVSPVFVAIGGALFLHEIITKREKVGISIAVLGTFLTISEPLFSHKLSFLNNLEGNILVFLGTLVWVIFTLLAKKYRNLDPFILSSFSFVVGLTMFLPLAVLKTSTLFLNASAIPGILFMAIFSSVVAYSTHLYGLSKIEASEAVVFTYLQPIFAIPVSVVFLQEKPSFFFFLGSFIITAGVIVSEIKIAKTKTALTG